MTCDIHDVCLGDCESRVTFDTNGRPVPLPVAVSATAASPDPRDAEIARLCALRDRYFAAAVATADAIDGGNLGPVHSGGESDAEFESACVRYAEELPLRAVVVRAELATARANTERSAAAMADVALAARAKLDAMTPPTLPPEIEAAIGDLVIAARDLEVAEMGATSQRLAAHRAAAISIADALRTAITSALAAAREAGRRDVLDGAAGVDAAIFNLSSVAFDFGMRRNDRERDATNAAEDALRAAIAADKARAVAIAEHDALLARPPALSRDAAEALIDEFARRFAARSRSRNRGTPVWEREADARAALLAALTGAGGGS